MELKRGAISNVAQEPELSSARALWSNCNELYKLWDESHKRSEHLHGCELPACSWTAVSLESYCYSIWL